MKTRNIFALVASLLFSITCAGCGGSGGGAPASGAVSSFSQGVVTAKGSITVGGVKFDTDNVSAVTMDDNASKGVNDLKVGMMVRVKGKIDDATKTGVAEKIEFADNLEGTIETKGVDTLIVFGQTVKVNNETIIEESSTGRILFENLSVSERIEVSGVPDNTGAIRATRIERKNGATEDMEIKGTVSDFAGTGDTMITLTPPNGAPLTVDIGGTIAPPVPTPVPTPVPENIRAAALPAGFGNGSFVEVKTKASGSTITATSVEMEVEMEAAENERMEVEGFVTILSAADKTFKVGNVTVSAGALPLPDNGAEVEVHGMMNKDGALVASEIEVEKECEIELEGRVAATADIDLAGKTLKLNGITVVTTNKTMFKDSDNTGGKTPLETFELRHINVDDQIEVVGIQSAATGKIVAVKIERKVKPLDLLKQMKIQGPVTAVNAAGNTFTLLEGITVDITGINPARVKDITGAPLLPAVFFSRLVLNQTVAVAEGTLSGTVLTAVEVQIKGP